MTTQQRNGTRRDFGRGLENPPGDLKTAADLAAGPAGPAKSAPAIPIETEVLYRNRVFVLRPTLRLDQLDQLCDRLDAMGAIPAPRPVEYSPDGHPICPRHRVPMRVREKQGDTWYSHKILDAQGREHFCKGHPGADSPGWSIQATPDSP